MSASARPFTQGLPPKTASAVDSPLFIQGLPPEKSRAVDLRLPRHRAGRATRRAAAAAAFACEYVIDYNGAAACRRCGYSARTAKQKAYELLHNPDVQQEIADLEAEIAARANLNADRIVAETHRVAFDLTEPAAARVRCLDMLLRITGKLVDRAEWSGPGGGPISMEVSDVRERIAGRLARIAAGN